MLYIAMEDYIMHKTAAVVVRVEPALKIKAERILYKIGISSSEAIRIFYTQVCLNEGIPFAIKVPNKTTQKAMRDAELRKTKKAKNVDVLFEELN